MSSSSKLLPKGTKCLSCLSTHYTDTCPNLPCRQGKYNSPDMISMKTLQPPNEIYFHKEISDLKKEIEQLKLINPCIYIQDINKGIGHLSNSLNEQFINLPSVARLQVSKGNFSCSHLICDTYKNIIITGENVKDTFIDGLIIEGNKHCELRIVIYNCYLSYVQIKAKSCKIFFYYKNVEIHGKISIKEKDSIIETSKLI